ncbi:MAG: hypothetical protein OM95_10745 [Bdellovibrio sp. ArHS]|nr:MAG: hypothetical protein OM95_10745 [Bdellovibrio sp. ArHS]
MTSTFNFFKNHLSCCLNCGSFLVIKGRFCRYCAQNLPRWELAQPVQVPPFQVIAHYEWDPGRSDILSSLIVSLKGPGNQDVWNFYAREFISKHLGSFPKNKRLRVVPAPPKRPDLKDHSFAWAQGLAEALGAELYPCLRKDSRHHQRGSDRAERALIEMSLIENSSRPVDFSPEIHWIFADDILTTGATARAAHIALGCPANFTVCVLAYRRLSCGASRHLL